jgi:hypothetical protein
LPAEALSRIASRQDGVASAVIEKYCEWVRNTAFLFHFADSVCARLQAVFDAGTKTDQARALIALIKLGVSHNRWYVMRVMLRCCDIEKISSEVGRRLAIEIRTEEFEHELRNCIIQTGWDIKRLAPDIAKLCA